MQEPIEIPRPFKLVRHGPKGPDSHRHIFCVTAMANAEAVRLGFSGKTAAIHGAGGSQSREVAQKLCDELNETFARYWRGEFH